MKDRPGIIAQLAAALAAEKISIEAVLQLPDENAANLPFVITVEPASEAVHSRGARAHGTAQLLHRAAAGDADGSVALNRDEPD